MTLKSFVHDDVVGVNAEKFSPTMNYSPISTFVMAGCGALEDGRHTFIADLGFDNHLIYFKSRLSYAPSSISRSPTTSQLHTEQDD